MYSKMQRIIYHGDMDICAAAEHSAKNALNKLYETLGITSGMQGWRAVTPLYDDVYVQLHIGLSADTIHIFTAEGLEAITINEPPEEIKKECLCTCNMSIGKIADRVLSGTSGTPYENLGLKEAPFYIYRVNICQDKFTYVAFENILGCDFTPWEVGMKVSVIAYNSFLFGCCLTIPGTVTEEDSLEFENFASFTATGCFGKVNPLTDMSDYSWRTTYRISQICALPRPYWEETNV